MPGLGSFTYEQRRYQGKKRKKKKKIFWKFFFSIQITPYMATKPLEILLDSNPASPRESLESCQMLTSHLHKGCYEIWLRTETRGCLYTYEQIGYSARKRGKFSTVKSTLETR